MLIIPLKVVRVDKDKHAAASLIPDARKLLRRRCACEEDRRPVHGRRPHAHPPLAVAHVQVFQQLKAQRLCVETDCLVILADGDGELGDAACGSSHIVLESVASKQAPHACGMLSTMMPHETNAPPLSEPVGDPARVLGFFDATCIVIGAIVGVGIFFNPSGVAKLTTSGDLALAAWALAGAIALCGGLTFAALGTKYNASGAQYELLRDAYGPMPAFLFVFCNATAIQAGAIGVIALLCAKNLVALANVSEHDARVPHVTLALALALIALLTLANILGVKWGSRVQNFTVVAKITAILCIVALAVVGAGHHGAATPSPASSSPLTTSLPGFQGVLAALVPAFFAYGGWQHSLWISGEIREPRRNLPRAIIVGVIIVVIVYVSANWAYLALLGHAGVASSNALAADAVATRFPDWGRRAIAAAVAISALGVLNAQLLSGPRLVYGMARDGRFFSPFARLHPAFGTPWGAILLLGGIGAALLAAVGAKGIDTLTAGAVFVDGIFFVLTGSALLILGQRKDGPRLPGSSLAAIVFVLGELGVLIGAALAPQMRQAVWGGLIWVAAAGVVYLIWFRRRSLARGA